MPLAQINNIWHYSIIQQPPSSPFINEKLLFVKLAMEAFDLDAYKRLKISV